MSALYADISNIQALFAAHLETNTNIFSFIQQQFYSYSQGLGLQNSSVAYTYLDAESSTDYCSQVPEMIQFPHMNAGCEIYSLSAVLASIGFDVDPDAIVDEYLPFDEVFWIASTAYMGDPYTTGGGLPPAIMRAGNAYLADQGSSIRFIDATGTSFENLERIVNGGLPVLVWTTMYLEEPDFSDALEPYTMYSQEHCLVMLGSDENTVSTMDPMVGYTSYDKDWFAYLYEQCGSMALILLVL